MLTIADSLISLTLAVMHANYFTLHKVFYCAKSSYKQSTKVICRLDRLGTAHSKGKKAVLIMEYLSAAHAFDYKVFRINTDLTTCKDLAMIMDNSLDNS